MDADSSYLYQITLGPNLFPMPLILHWGVGSLDRPNPINQSMNEFHSDYA